MNPCRERVLTVPASVSIDALSSIYYHSRTYQAIHPEEFGIDSEDELDMDWLRETTSRVRAPSPARRSCPVRHRCQPCMCVSMPLSFAISAD